MMRLAADENFNHNIVRGLLRRRPNLDLMTVQDAGLSGTDDPEVLEWAARQGRVLLTHDVTTMTAYAFERVRNGLPMPGVVEVPRRVAIADAIEDILLLADCSLEGEWEGQVLYLPLTRSDFERVAHRTGRGERQRGEPVGARWMSRPQGDRIPRPDSMHPCKIRRFVLELVRRKR